jgi:hypothetical protein
VRLLSQRHVRREELHAATCELVCQSLRLGITGTTLKAAGMLAEAQAGWEYTPSSAPAPEPDPAQLLQLQLSMHVTGTDHGYLVSWARTSMHIVRIPYSMQAVTAIAHSLKAVYDAYSTPGTQVPCSLGEMPPELRGKLSELGSQVARLCSSCRRIGLPGAHFWNNVALAGCCADNVGFLCTSSWQTSRLPDAISNVQGHLDSQVLERLLDLVCKGAEDAHKLPALAHDMWLSSDIEAMPVPLQDGQVLANERGLTEGARRLRACQSLRPLGTNVFV